MDGIVAQHLCVSVMCAASGKTVITSEHAPHSSVRAAMHQNIPSEILFLMYSASGTYPQPSRCWPLNTPSNKSKQQHRSHLVSMFDKTEQKLCKTTKTKTPQKQREGDDGGPLMCDCMHFVDQILPRLGNCFTYRCHNRTCCYPKRYVAGQPSMSP